MVTSGEFELALNILGQYVRLNIYAIVCLSAAERCDRERVRNEGHAESIFLDIYERQADTVYCDRSFAGHLSDLRGGNAKLHRTPIGVVAPGIDRADGVDMAGDVMAADWIAGSKRLFEVDHRTGQQFSEIRPGERLFASLK